MTIEVRQMVIKSSVVQRTGEDVTGEQVHLNVEALKEDIREECRRLFQEWLRAQRDR